MEETGVPGGKLSLHRGCSTCVPNLPKHVCIVSCHDWKSRDSRAESLGMKGRLINGRVYRSEESRSGPDSTSEEGWTGPESKSEEGWPERGSMSKEGRTGVDV